MIEFINPKINIGLYVISRRPDGYHNLSTVFYPIGKLCGIPDDDSRLADILEITLSNHDSFTSYGRAIACRPEDNLVVKALALFKDKLFVKTGKTINAKIELYKNIPDGAGLGGGSADAAGTLRILNELADSIFTKEDLLDMALQLGADCPFFIIDTPCYAEGIGEMLQPVSLSLDGKFVLVLKPDIYISTREAFSKVECDSPEYPLVTAVQTSIREWPDMIFNDFEKSAFAIYPELVVLKSKLYEYGALYASMSGSGSAFYGIFDTKEVAEQALRNIDCVYKAVVAL